MANILVVDDSEMFREIIKDILEKAGQTVIGMGANGTLYCLPIVIEEAQIELIFSFDSDMKIM